MGRFVRSVSWWLRCNSGQILDWWGLEFVPSSFRRFCLAGSVCVVVVVVVVVGVGERYTTVQTTGILPTNICQSGVTARVVRTKSKARLLQQSRNASFHLQESSASYDAVTAPFLRHSSLERTGSLLFVSFMLRRGHTGDVRSV